MCQVPPTQLQLHKIRLQAVRTASAEVIESVYRESSRRVYATLVRLLGDFDLAEDALHDAFTAAMETWPKSGVPANPSAWLISAGRFKAIDALRRQARFDPIGDREFATDAEPSIDEHAVEDERLRLVFTCCHPSIAPDAQVALTLREVCGLTTEEIAHAFLTPAPTLAQRIVRAKSKIRDAKIPFVVPEGEDLPERLQSVLRVVYLVFNEGYSASFGDDLHRADLASEAVRLGELLFELLPEPEVAGLLALMLLHNSRRAARTTPEGDLIPLDKQDRALWDAEMIRRGGALVEESLRSRRFGSYTLQAAISAVHSEAGSYEATDWPQIIGLYRTLLVLESSPIVELNLAVAVAMRDGPAAGISRVEALIANGGLTDYHLAHAARADLFERLGNVKEAKASYERALELTSQSAERRYLQKKLDELKVQNS